MYKYILAIGLLTFTVMAQQQQQPGPPPPAPARPLPRRDGDSERDVRDGPTPMEGDDDEPCPPRTGREWICKVG